MATVLRSLRAASTVARTTTTTATRHSTPSNAALSTNSSSVAARGAWMRTVGSKTAMHWSLVAAGAGVTAAVAATMYENTVCADGAAAAMVAAATREAVCAQCELHRSKGWMECILQHAIDADAQRNAQHPEWAPITFRLADKEDMSTVLRYIKELAEFEREPHEVENTEAQLVKDGFGPRPMFWSVIIEDHGKPIGFALAYVSYSTWKGRCLYLEDLYIEPAHRGKGIGHRAMVLFTEAAKIGNFARLHWQVLNWNKQARKTYDHMGARVMSEWLNYRMDRHAISAVLEREKIVSEPHSH